MKARIRQFLSDLGHTFFLVPGLMVLGGIVLALITLGIDRSGVLPAWLMTGQFLYNGGATGARTLLGAVASSTIGVASTVFSITIAALSLAAGQMGPRLLRNFTSDRGNQVTLGIFLGTFSYALMVLRSVRTQEEGMFIPHLALSVSILLALICVATLVYFVGHMASRINVDTVITLVSRDVRGAIKRLTQDDPGAPPPDETFWLEAVVVRDARRGYLQQLDHSGLADWACERKTAIRLLVRPGDYVFPGAPIALLTVPVEGAGDAIRDATALGSLRVSGSDIEFAIRQLVEVAVRALSPGINDPHTAISVLDHLGASLCDVAQVHMRSGVLLREGRPALVCPAVDYDGLSDAMFHMIRQNAVGSAAVRIRMLDVLIAVAECERIEARLGSLQRHADLILADCERDIANPSDLQDVSNRHRAFSAIQDKVSARSLTATQSA